MSRYDGLIIPRSYNEYINKTDPVAMAQALQLNNVLAQEVAAGNNKAVTSNAVNGALANYEKLYTSLLQLEISTNITTLANVWEKLPNNAVAKLDKNLFTDTMPNNDSAFILFEKLTVARGKITYYTKDSNNTYLMCLNSSNEPTGTWEKLVTDKVNKYVYIETNITNVIDISTLSKGAYRLSVTGDYSVGSYYGILFIGTEKKVIQLHATNITVSISGNNVEVKNIGNAQNFTIQIM